MGPEVQLNQNGSRGRQESFCDVIPVRIIFVLGHKWEILQRMLPGTKIPLSLRQSSWLPRESYMDLKLFPI